MKCAWQELLTILPPWVAAQADARGRDTLQELRLRLGLPPELICQGKPHWLSRNIREEDLKFCINTASHYSPWAAKTAAQGYITAPGGHRIGICGEAVMQNGIMTGIRSVRSLCVRVARDFEGISSSASGLTGSILIIGPPGSGKSTLLRDLARQLSQKESVSVVDERGELFPEGFDRGQQLDVLTGCKKPAGIDTVLRVMGPACIAVDEITAKEDCHALQQAAWCGVRLLATAHASCICDLKQRNIYRPLIEQKLFDHILVMNRDKSWKAERMEL